MTPEPTVELQLLLEDVQSTNTGFYTCVAVSDTGVSQAWTYLEVLDGEARGGGGGGGGGRVLAAAGGNGWRPKRGCAVHRQLYWA